MERRQDVRVPWVTGVECEDLATGERLAGGQLSDISLSGVFLYGVPLRPEGTRLLLRFTLPSLQMQLEAAVVHTTPAGGMGLAFLDPTPVQRVVIQELMRTDAEAEAGGAAPDPQLDLWDAGLRETMPLTAVGDTPDPEPEAELSADPEVEPDPEVAEDVEPEIEPDVEPEVEADLEPEIEPDEEPEVEADVEPAAGPDTAAEVAPEPAVVVAVEPAEHEEEPPAVSDEPPESAVDEADETDETDEAAAAEAADEVWPPPLPPLPELPPLPSAPPPLRQDAIAEPAPSPEPEPPAEPEPQPTPPPEPGPEPVSAPPPVDTPRPADPLPPPLPPAKEAATTDSDRSRVLVVDDHDRTRVMLRGMIEGRDKAYAVTEASDGEECLRTVDSQGPFDLIFLDVDMPNMDGLTACRELRARGVRSFIVMLTGRSELEDFRAGRDAGADTYIKKPIVLGTLRSMLGLFTSGSLQRR